MLDHDETIRPDTTSRAWPASSPALRHRAQAGFDDVALEKYHWVEKIDHVPRRQLLGHRRRRRADGDRLRGGRAELGLTPRARIVATAVSGADPTIMLTGPGGPQGAGEGGPEVEDIDLFEINEAFAAVAMRFMRDLGVATRSPTSTAARSRWATRSARLAR